MKQKVLSVEQMRYLTDEFGVDTSDASMCWLKDYKINKEFSLDIFSDVLKKIYIDKENFIDCIPSYTLEDILEKLPQQIKVSDGNSLKDRAFLEMNKIAKSGYHMAYEQSWDNGKKLQIKMHGAQMHESALQCAYDLFIWCIKNGHIDLHNTEEGELDMLKILRILYLKIKHPTATIYVRVWANENKDRVYFDISGSWYCKAANEIIIETY